MPAPTSVPRTLNQITPDWLTRILRRDGCIGRSAVNTIAVEGIGAEVGFLDVLARLRLTYDQPEGNAPASVVVKLPAPDGIYRRIGSFYHAYEREIRFYAEAAPCSPLCLPRCFCGAMDRQADSYVLVLEDLQSLAAGDQVEGLTAAQARACVETIGRFHAAWWNPRKLAALGWMPHRNIQPSRYHSAWPTFRQTIGSLLGAQAVELGDQLDTHLEDLLCRIEEGPHTIVHSDFRADNFLFDEQLSPPSVVVLDWQLAIRSRGALDVARLLCGSLASAERARCERDVLQRWHGTLEAGGVRDYSFQQALEDYRRCALVCLYYPVTIHAAEEAAGARGTALAQAQIERFFTAALELDAASLLPR
jgi:aminoglycoside phosphotransferase (APT) family kinase protein